MAEPYNLREELKEFQKLLDEDLYPSDGYVLAYSHTSKCLICYVSKEAFWDRYIDAELFWLSIYQDGAWHDTEHRIISTQQFIDWQAEKCTTVLNTVEAEKLVREWIKRTYLIFDEQITVGSCEYEAENNGYSFEVLTDFWIEPKEYFISAAASRPAIVEKSS